MNASDSSRPSQIPTPDNDMIASPQDVEADASATKDTIGPEEPSPLVPYSLRNTDVIAAALLGAAFLLLSRWPLWYTDVWGHLKFGQWIVQHRALPAREPFTPIADAQPCIHFYWLGQSALYLLFSAGEGLAGGDGLHRLAGGVDVLATFFGLMNVLRCLLLLLAYRRASGSMPLACVGLIAALIVVSRVQRPQILGEVFFAALLLALSRPVLSRAALILVPIGLVVWANVHGSFAAGLALLGLFFLGRVLAIVRTASSSRWSAVVHDPQVRRLFLTGLLSTLAITLFNPHGPQLLLDTLRFSQNPNIPSMDEWKPLTFSAEPGDHWVYGATIVLVIVTQILSPRLLSPTTLLLCFTFGVLPLWQRRMLIWWFILVPWIVLPAWAELGRRLNWFWLRVQSAATPRKTFLAVFLLLLAAWLSPPLQWLRGHQPRPLERSLSPGTPWKLAAQLTAPGDKTFYPELSAALQRGYPDGRFQGRIFASETQGDYLLWALPPEYPVLVYTHVHLFSPQHWRDCLTVLKAAPGWREILDRHSVNLVVVEVEEHSQLTKALMGDVDWQIVVDETGMQQKRDPRTRLLIALRKKPLPVAPLEPG